MKLEYQGFVRRIDLRLRSKFPYLDTTIYKIHSHKYEIFVSNISTDFLEIARDFDEKIKNVTTPVYLVDKQPKNFKNIIEKINDHDIPSSFEGLSFSQIDLVNHIQSFHSEYVIDNINEDHVGQEIIITLKGSYTEESRNNIEESLKKLKQPYNIKIKDGGTKEYNKSNAFDVFSIASAHSVRSLNCDFIERDEKLWLYNINDIYDGSLKKKDIYFYNEKETSCLVDFSLFNNCNIRNYLLLYDVIYCILPLIENMSDFLNKQQISRQDILYLIAKGRLKIVNTQPEARIDHGFINEAYEENKSSVISRRGLSVLCAIDIVDINEKYILNDPDLEKLLVSLSEEISPALKTTKNALLNNFLWPKQALRGSFEALHKSGVMGASSYGVNNVIISNLRGANRTEMKFEFSMHSTNIHLAHALDATYFPFFTEDGKYSDYPYTLMMGNMLNTYKSNNYENISYINNENPTMNLMSIFEPNVYIPIDEFEKDISNSIITGTLNSLFSDLSNLSLSERNDRIEKYNSDISKKLSTKGNIKNALDLGEDAAGLFMPFIATGKKIMSFGFSKAKDKYPVLQEFSEHIEEKVLSSIVAKKDISILTKVNRVARLRKRYS